MTTIAKNNIERVFIFLGVIFYLFVFPHGIHGDGAVRYEGLQEFLQTGYLKPMFYSYVGPLISSPLLLLGNIVKDGYWWISRFNTFLYLGLMGFAYQRISFRFNPAMARRFILLMMIGTMFPRHIADYYGEVFSTVLIVMGLWWSVDGFSGRGAVAAILSLCNTPGTLVGGALAHLNLSLKERRFRFLLIPIVAFLGIALESYWKAGEFFPSNYISTFGYKNALPYSGIPGFSYPLFFGVLSVLFSFGKGLLFFTPGLLALFFSAPNAPLDWSKLRSAGIFYLIGLILVYSRWWAWSGDWFWGPRFYLFASFLAIMGIFSLWWREQRTLPTNLFLLCLITLSVWVSAQGITFGTDDLEYCGIEGGKMFFMCHYTPEFSALWRAFAAENRGVNGKQLAFLVFHALGYFVLTNGLWGETLRQLRERAKSFFVRIADLKAWKW